MKLVRAKDRALDARSPHMSMSHATYLKGVEHMRKQAIREHKVLITDDGVEDYRDVDSSESSFPFPRN